MIKTKIKMFIRSDTSGFDEMNILFGLFFFTIFQKFSEEKG